MAFYFQAQCSSFWYAVIPFTDPRSYLASLISCTGLWGRRVVFPRFLLVIQTAAGKIHVDSEMHIYDISVPFSFVSYTICLSSLSCFKWVLYAHSFSLSVYVSLAGSRSVGWLICVETPGSSVSLTTGSPAAWTSNTSSGHSKAQLGLKTAGVDYSLMRFRQLVNIRNSLTCWFLINRDSPLCYRKLGNESFFLSSVEWRNELGRWGLVVGSVQNIYWYVSKCQALH